MKIKKIYSVISFFIVFNLFLSGCSPLTALGLGKKVVVQVVYGSEKQEWLEPAIKAFNETKTTTSEGSQIEIQATPMGSIEAVEQIMSGTLQPVVWSPASSLYIPVANMEWRKNHSDDLVSDKAKDLVLSPVVIAMWKPMAEALGWPDKSIGWGDIAGMATAADGWEKFGYPEWGQFKFGHTHPAYSNSGLVAIVAQAYAGAGKQRSLTNADLQNTAVKDFMANVQASIIHYGTSTGFFATRMFEKGPSYLSAAVLYENLVVSQESKRLSGASSQIPVVAIYPKEGTFWANHPYCILNAPWVTVEQREAAEKFQTYLLDKPQQVQAIQLGFRPSDPSIALTVPLDSQHGIDPQQPKTVLEIPKADVINNIQTVWKEIKKPVDLAVVVDVSGSMSGEKIAAARTSLVQFINLLEDRDRLQVITFSSDVNLMMDLTELGPKRIEITRRVSAIIEGGDTALYDAVVYAYQELEKNANPKHIRAVVVLSDGNDTASVNSINDVVKKIGSKSEEGGNSIKLFTIGYGDDFDADVLKKMAESTGGRQYEGKPENINQVYSEIATFF
ncbi:MAG: substrate-binding and VWA domain-containing protein [Anaerolineae bacterium]|nr:substrate-binding and VWA domain-containing protein [Anaerolineae bacterium]